MKIGILHEGRYDIDPLSAIVNLILKEIGCSKKIEYPAVEAGGSILPKMAAAAVIFFEGSSKCELALYISDKDYDPRKKAKIVYWVNNYCRQNPDGNFVIGCPEPYLEQWFLNDEDSIRSTFSLPAKTQLPFSDETNPKERFVKIIEYFNVDSSKGKKDLYAEVASNINLQELSRLDPSFKQFYKDLKQALRKLC